MQHENSSQSRSWRSFSKLTLLGPLALVLALGFWFLGPAADHPAPQGYPPAYSQMDDGPPPPPPDDGPGGFRRPPRGEHGHQHGPPGPPPTVIFLIGGALGFLIGRQGQGCQRKRCCGCQCEKAVTPRVDD